MLMIFHLPPPLATTAEHGFTLIELLVAMALSIIVRPRSQSSRFSVRQQTRINDRAQADRIGRGAMSTRSSTPALELHRLRHHGHPGPRLDPPTSAGLQRDLRPVVPKRVRQLHQRSAASPASPSTTSTGRKRAPAKPVAAARHPHRLLVRHIGGISPKWKFPALTVANAKKKRSRHPRVTGPGRQSLRAALPLLQVHHPGQRHARRTQTRRSHHPEPQPSPTNSSR